LPTPFDEIYDNFLMKVSDYAFLEMTENELEIDFQKYLKSSCVKFRQCDKNLLQNFDDENQRFSVDLDYYEIEILATLMIIEYITPKIVSSENLKQIIGNREFKFYSQASQLQELIRLRSVYRLEATQLISEYTYARGLDTLE
jgi:hypothetical protein